MRKLLALCFVCAFAGGVMAQEEAEKPSAATLRYHKYRIQITEPTYGLTKVKSLIKKIKKDSDFNQRITSKAYNSMSFQEKFTYAMIHGEDEAQNCDMMPIFTDEEKKIFGYIPDAFSNETGWSERQRDFLSNNRAKVVPLLRETMKSHQRVGVNLKNAIRDIDAYELIPDMIAIYNVKKVDQDILSLLMFMMKEGKFEPFMKSQSYEKLYGEKSNYRGFIEANSENQKLVCDRAMAYYKSRKK